MPPDPGLDIDHWMVIGYCDHGRLGSGRRAMYLKNSNGMEVMLYDCFGVPWRLKRSAFKIKQLLARGIDIPFNFDKFGWLCAVPPVGEPIRLCPWELADNKNGNIRKINTSRDVLLPTNDLFQLSVPPPKIILEAVTQR